MIKKLLSIGIIIAIAILGITITKPKLVQYVEIKKAEERKKIATETNEVLLDVPFICQAPLETEINWKSHEESCEEAAILQAYLFETDMEMTKEEANEEILNMIQWEKDNFGSHKDIYAPEVKELITKYYSISEEKITIIPNADISDIKASLAEGHPVIVPITGEILNNPYYPYPGYHMLVVIGFNEDYIITNDNGTKRGEGFSYDIETFEMAMKDAGGDIIIIKTKNQ